MLIKLYLSTPNGIFADPMMRIANLFFLTLCYLLLRGHNGVYADSHPGNSGTSLVQQIEEAKGIYAANADHNIAFIKNALPGQEPKYIVAVEDEVEDLVFSRKYVLLAKYFVTLSFAFLLSYFCSTSKVGLPLSKHLSFACSYKYLLQRALRI